MAHGGVSVTQRVLDLSLIRASSTNLDAVAQSSIASMNELTELRFVAASER